MKKSTRLILLLALFIFCSCGDDELPQVETLQGFRVLAIVADNPEVAPGASADLSLLVSDIGGAGRTISGSWRACPDPGIALGANPSCEGVTGATSASSFSINFSSLGASYTGLDSTTFTVNVPSNLLDSADTVTKTNGAGYVAIFRFQVDGKEMRAFKTIIVSNRTTKNSNPGTPTIRRNGAALTQLPAVDDTLTIDNLTDEETYQLYFSDGTLITRTENYELAWYVSKTELSAGKVAESDTVTVKSAPTQAPFVAVVVVRDERGGVSYQVVNVP